MIVFRINMRKDGSEPRRPCTDSLRSLTLLSSLGVVVKELIASLGGSTTLPCVLCSPWQHGQLWTLIIEHACRQHSSPSSPTLHHPKASGGLPALVVVVSVLSQREAVWAAASLPWCLNIQSKFFMCTHLHPIANKIDIQTRGLITASSSYQIH